jgi:hypothetical protein
MFSKNNQKTEYIWEGNIEFWETLSPISYCGNFKNNIYQYKDKTYHHMVLPEILYLN